jgi:hypothetical protein
MFLFVRQRAVRSQLLPDINLRDAAHMRAQMAPCIMLRMSTVG